MVRVTKVGGRRPVRKGKRMLPPKTCKACDNQFLPRTQSQVYCTAVCRIEHYRAQGRYLPDPETVTEEELREIMSSYLRHAACFPLTGEATFRW